MGISNVSELKTKNVFSLIKAADWEADAALKAVCQETVKQLLDIGIQYPTVPGYHTAYNVSQYIYALLICSDADSAEQLCLELIEERKAKVDTTL